MQTVIVINNDQMGLGDPALGTKILKTFLQKLPAKNTVTAVVLYNEAIKLMVEGSPVLQELQGLMDAGIDVLPCVTCVDFHDLQLALGETSTMDEIVAELMKAEKVITL